MPYYHRTNNGDVRLNLYSANSSRYPSSDGSGKACQTSLPSVPASKGGTLTLKNQTLSMGSLRAYKNSTDGPFIGDRLTYGSSDYDVYNDGSRSYKTSPFYSGGAVIYYDVSVYTPDNPIVYVMVRAVNANGATTSGGSPYYKYITVSGVDSGTVTHSIYTEDEYYKVTMDGSKTITITTSVYDYNIGSSSGSASPGWCTSYSFSGSWSICKTPSKIYLSVTINSEGTNSGYITLSSGSWSGSWYSSSWKNTKITSISASTTGITFNATKNNTSKPNLSWSATAYYSF